jgi:hypothetical protein
MRTADTMRIEIGEHAIGIANDDPASHQRTELCVMAIGIQPIGNCVVRSPDGGRYVSATRLHGYGRTAIGAYVEVDPERQIPSAGEATSATESSIALALATAIIVIALSRSAASLARAAMLMAWRSTRSYIRRELTSQWRFVVGFSLPAVGMAAWILTAIVGG